MHSSIRSTHLFSQGAMQNGMMNPNVMGNQGSPMMQNMADGQFMGTMPMGDIYGTRMGANGAMPGPGAASGGNHALQDYQMQLMLLEQIGRASCRERV